VRIADVRQDFEEFVASRRRSLSDIDATAAVQLMIEFYVGVRADDVDPDDGGDMLLFQWGVYDWGVGASFEYGIARQLIWDDKEDQDSAFWQLSLTLRYEPNDETNALGCGEKWCSGVAEIDALREGIEAAQATSYARRSRPRTVDLDFGPAG
jgi:hypothetical protein